MPQHTLDLFGDTSCRLATRAASGAMAGLTSENVRAGVNSNLQVTTPDLAPGANAPVTTAAAGSQVDHLAAAQRLHRRLRRATAYSPEEIKAGRLICRHLVALINTPAATQQH